MPLADHPSSVHAGLDRKPGESNWVDKAGGLPSYIERIAKHLHADSGMTISRAIAVAVNAAKRMCATGDLNFSGKQSVNPGSRAQACKAVAEWEAKKASTGGGSRKLTDIEMSEVVGQVILLAAGSRAPGASGSNKAFDETKYLRNPANGKFSSKFTPTELIAGRRIVEGGITNLQVGQTFELPGDSGWVKRSEAGYLIQGPAGIRVVAETLSDAVEAAASIIAGKLAEVGEPTK